MHRYTKTICITCEKMVSDDCDICPVCLSITYTTGCKFRPPRKGSKDWDKLRACILSMKNPDNLIPTYYLVQALK